jgi:5-formyltetrahydrofolate cyclo-ligase
VGSFDRATRRRVHKGSGLSDLELAVAAEAGVIDPSTVVVTTVHDLQVRALGEIPTAGHDIHVDLVVTPERGREDLGHPAPATPPVA